jgi:SNF2 family DNA or RNA helicase
LKGGQTAQGNAFGLIAGRCKHVIAMTGTLVGGYADDLFHVLRRVSPIALNREEYGWNETQRFLEHYGILERVAREKENDEDNKQSRGKSNRVTVSRKPGVSPLVFTRFLAERTAFLSLDELGKDLPPYREFCETVNMTREQADKYETIERALIAELRAELKRGSKRLLGAYLQTLLRTPDQPYERIQVIADGRRIVSADALDGDIQYPKEKRLLEILKTELDAGRRCFIFATYTGKYDQQPRLARLISEAGYKCAILANVDPADREAWIEEQHADGAQVIVCNPELVKTGLDLVNPETGMNYPTLIFFQTGYSTFTLRQASRRSYRVIQTEECRTYFLCYRSTLQEKALALMSKKQRASLALEGKFSSEGLAAMTDGGDDLGVALAQALVEKADLGPAESYFETRPVSRPKVVAQVKIPAPTPTKPTPAIVQPKTAPAVVRVQTQLF